MALHAGTTLGPYSVTAKIDAGGMSEVYRARDTKLDRDVVSPRQTSDLYPLKPALRSPSSRCLRSAGAAFHFFSSVRAEKLGLGA